MRMRSQDQKTVAFLARVYPVKDVYVSSLERDGCGPLVYQSLEELVRGSAKEVYIHGTRLGEYCWRFCDALALWRTLPPAAPRRRMSCSGCRMHSVHSQLCCVRCKSQRYGRSDLIPLS